MLPTSALKTEALENEYKDVPSQRSTQSSFDFQMHMVVALSFSDLFSQAGSILPIHGITD